MYTQTCVYDTANGEWLNFNNSVRNLNLSWKYITEEICKY